MGGGEKDWGDLSIGDVAKKGDFRGSENSKKEKVLGLKNFEQMCSFIFKNFLINKCCYS